MGVSEPVASVFSAFALFSDAAGAVTVGAAAAGASF